MMILYGVPLSQPFRSVAWTLLQKHVKFQVKLVVPGSPHKKNGAKGEDFLALTGGRSNRIPILQDDDNFVVLESPAILTYLCQSHGWTDLYPADLKQRTNVDSYLHWHHEGTRLLARMIMPALRPDLQNPALEPDKLQEQAHTVLTQLDSAWLAHDSYLVGPQLSIADIMCYGEVAQAAMMGAITLSDYPNLSDWSRRMQQLEFHDEVHVALTTVGNAFDDASKGPVAKRLGPATKEGLKSIEDAQKRYCK